MIFGNSKRKIAQPIRIDATSFCRFQSFVQEPRLIESLGYCFRGEDPGKKKDGEIASESLFSAALQEWTRVNYTSEVCCNKSRKGIFPEKRHTSAPHPADGRICNCCCGRNARSRWGSWQGLPGWYYRDNVDSRRSPYTLVSASLPVLFSAPKRQDRHAMAVCRQGWGGEGD